MEFLRKNFKLFDKKSGIYLIKIEDHKYVGSARNLRNRLNQHEWSLKAGRHHNQTLQNCYNKYTIKKVSFEILEECAVEDLLMREVYYIKYLQADMNHVKDPTNISIDEISRLRLKSSLRKYYTSHESISNKRVYQYSIEGEYVGEFKSVAEASKQTGIHNSSICNVCRNLKGTAGNYQWRYEKVDNVGIYKTNNGVKPILQIDPISKEIVRIWKTQNIIEKELGYKRKFISAACESGEIFKGFLWMKGESKKDIKKKQPKFIPGTPVHQYDLQGNYIKSFNSAKEAERQTGICSNVICRSILPDTPNKSAGGFLWSPEKVDKMPIYQNFSDKAKVKKIWVFNVLTGEELEFESIAEAVRNLNPNATNFDGDCATLSHCANNSGYYKHYIAKNENSDYKLTTRNTQVYNTLTGEVFSSVKDAVRKTNNSSWMIKKWASDETNKEWFYLNECARVKLRESGKIFS